MGRIVTKVLSLIWGGDGDADTSQQFWTLGLRRCRAVGDTTSLAVVVVLHL